MDQMERRAFMKGAGSGVLAFTAGGVEVLLTPGAARAQGIPFRTLTAAQAATLEALGETLVPGARQAGISHFVDQQISIPAEEALLEARQRGAQRWSSFRPAWRERATQLGRQHASEQDRRLARPGWTIRLPAAA
jgi:hypothetical protein